MTVGQLIKLLEELKKENPKTKVSVDITEMRDKVNDCFNVIPVDEAKVEYIEVGDGDGWGTGKFHKTIVLR